MKYPEFFDWHDAIEAKVARSIPLGALLWQKGGAGGTFVLWRATEPVTYVGMVWATAGAPGEPPTWGAIAPSNGGLLVDGASLRQAMRTLKAYAQLGDHHG